MTYTSHPARHRTNLWKMFLIISFGRGSHMGLRMSLPIKLLWQFTKRFPDLGSLRKAANASSAHDLIRAAHTAHISLAHHAHYFSFFLRFHFFQKTSMSTRHILTETNVWAVESANERRVRVERYQSRKFEEGAFLFLAASRASKLCLLHHEKYGRVPSSTWRGSKAFFSSPSSFPWESFLELNNYVGKTVSGEEALADE